MAGHPLRPATDRRLGRLLPYQLANRTQAPLETPGLLPALLSRVYAVLARVSSGCPPLQGRFLRVTHPSATRHQFVLLQTMLPFDLHVLSMPPAFNLSQDQTLQFNTFASLKPAAYLFSLKFFKAPTQFVFHFLNQLRPEGVLRILLIQNLLSITFLL